MKKAVIVVTSHADLGDSGKKTGWYLPEVTHVYFPLVEAGYLIDFASPKGGSAPLDPQSLDLEDELNRRFVEDKKLFAKIDTTLELAKLNPKDYQIIFFAGGHGTMWDFPENRDIQRLVPAIYEQGGIVAAVCHGPAALVNIKLPDGDYFVADKDVNSFTNTEEESIGLAKVVPFLLETKLRERGARFHAGAPWTNKVVTAERLITGQNPKSALSVGQKIVEVAQTLKN